MLNLLPAPARIWIETCFPEWTLPSRLVLKKQKDGWDDEFETEKATYAKLRSLQGVATPRLFGELRYENTRAILLSGIGGACLATPEGALLEMSDFRRLVYQAMDAFAPFGMLQDDNKLDNYHFIGDKVMIVDLERMNEGLTDREVLASLIRSEVEFLAKGYENIQYLFWSRGLVVIDTWARNGPAATLQFRIPPSIPRLARTVMFTPTSTRLWCRSVKMKPDAWRRRQCIRTSGYGSWKAKPTASCGSIPRFPTWCSRPGTITAAASPPDPCRQRRRHPGRELPGRLLGAPARGQRRHNALRALQAVDTGAPTVPGHVRDTHSSRRVDAEVAPVLQWLPGLAVGGRQHDHSSERFPARA